MDWPSLSREPASLLLLSFFAFRPSDCPVFALSFESDNDEEGRVESQLSEDRVLLGPCDFSEVSRHTYSQKVSSST